MDLGCGPDLGQGGVLMGTHAPFLDPGVFRASESIFHGVLTRLFFRSKRSLMLQEEKILCVIFFRDWKRAMVEDGYHSPLRCHEKRVCEETGSDGVGYCDKCEPMLDKKFSELKGSDKKNFLAMIGFGGKNG